MGYHKPRPPLTLMLAGSSNTTGACQLWCPQVALEAQNRIFGDRLSAGSHKSRLLSIPAPAYLSSPVSFQGRVPKNTGHHFTQVSARASDPRHLPPLQVGFHSGLPSLLGTHSFVSPAPVNSSSPRWLLVGPGSSSDTRFQVGSCEPRFLIHPSTDGLQQPSVIVIAPGP